MEHSLLWSAESARSLIVFSSAQAMGTTFYYCGTQGMGLRAKLTQNLILGNLLQAFNEGFVMSTKAVSLQNLCWKSSIIALPAPAS